MACFYCLELSQQSDGRQLRVESRDGIDEIRLRGMADGRRAVKRRASRHAGVRQPRELVEGSQNLSPRILEIGADADVGERHAEAGVGAAGRFLRRRRRRL